ncbi:Panacea domain-containing protein [Actinobacillus seminis]|uniref:Panacea domain-containing protein n=1 Tax=Actinobacillus seminis TaxID=722 RepID=UPI003B931B3D
MMNYVNYKSLAVANYLLDKAINNNDTLTPMQLIKLAYIAHGWMLGKHGAALLLEPVEAWQYGPVIPSIYQAVRYYKSAPVQSIEGYSKYAPIQFTDEEKAVMDDVYQKYAKYDGIVLSNATHQPQSPWSQVPVSYPALPISNDLIEHFYRNHVINTSHSAL